MSTASSTSTVYSFQMLDNGQSEILGRLYANGGWTDALAGQLLSYLNSFPWPNGGAISASKASITEVDSAPDYSTNPATFV